MQLFVFFLFLNIFSFFLAVDFSFSYPLSHFLMIVLPHYINEMTYGKCCTNKEAENQEKKIS